MSMEVVEIKQTDDVTEANRRRREWYSVKVWAYTILISPIVVLIYMWIKFGSGSDLARVGLVLFISTFITAGVSLPVLAIFWYVFNALKETQKSFRRLRLMLCGFVAGLFCMMYILANSFSFGGSDLIIWGAYLIVAIVAIWIIKLREEC